MQPDSAPTARREPGSPRRRTTIWTILAPAGAVLLFILLFSAASGSCVVHGNCAKSSDSKSTVAKPANRFKSGTKAKVVAGMSMGSIAAKYGLTVADLQACNPTIDSQALQPGQRLNVSAADCEGQDLAPVGANPDPLAGDTNTAATAAAKAKQATAARAAAESKNNGTAAADPTASRAGTQTTATTDAGN
ncbi:MAG: hypothetical protein JWN41_1332 [Thermoleophilia bacterium]|nr:hypothetical protein [Thermoleophilia bacterium]